MTDGPLPTLTLRLELDQMRTHLVRNMSAHHDDIQKLLNEEMTKLIENYDFAAAVKRNMVPIFDDLIRIALLSHFTHGKGKEIIREAIDLMLSGNEEQEITP